MFQNRKAIQRELRLYELSQVEGIIDPYFDEAIAKRRNKRQVTGVDFPSDDEDTLTADGSGDAIEKEILQGSNENTPFPNDPAASATDWSEFLIEEKLRLQFRIWRDFQLFIKFFSMF